MNSRRLPVLLLSALLALTLVALPGAAHARITDRTWDYQEQVSCDPHPKPGVVAFKDLMLSKFGGGDYGIVRACHVGGLSEHKEGRAWDWKLNAHSAADRKVARRALRWLLAERDGEPAARARDFGIMYMIWNRRIWRGYDIDGGWQPYSGASPHTDHIHISFTWNGATGQTVWWTGEVQPYDYGPCQRWVDEQARPWRKPRLTPCPEPLHRPQAVDGYYAAQPGERVRRVARFFDKTGPQIRRWNGYPRRGVIDLPVGTLIRVVRPGH